MCKADQWDVFSFENSVGFGRHFALLMSGFLQIWFLVASFGTWWSIERFGRRRSFITSAIGMASVMAIMAAMLAIDTPASGIVAAVMLFAYQAFYTWGFMGGIWVSRPQPKDGSFLTGDSAMALRSYHLRTDPRASVSLLRFYGCPRS